MRHVTYEGTTGNRVKRAREAKGWTQERLAREANADRSQINQIEKDKRGLGQDVAERLARALGVEITDLLPPKDERVTLSQVDRRLRELEGAELVTREDLERSLDALRAAIAAQASQGSRPANAEGEPR